MNSTHQKRVRNARSALSPHPALHRFFTEAHWRFNSGFTPRLTWPDRRGNIKVTMMSETATWKIHRKRLEVTFYQERLCRRIYRFFFLKYTEILSPFYEVVISIWIFIIMDVTCEYSISNLLNSTQYSKPYVNSSQVWVGKKRREKLNAG